MFCFFFSSRRRHTISLCDWSSDVCSSDLVRGPASWTVDTSLAKNFRLTEAMRLQVRLDAFNALNHVNYNNPVPNMLAPDFGQITSAGNPRAVQIGARFSF